jgi:hypothetical protein
LGKNNIYVLNMTPLPKDYQEYFRNSSTDFCDMLVGPCACGASHDLSDWSDLVLESAVEEGLIVE